jgi:hypothetical protein
MLALLQVITHMIVGLEYTEAEVKAAFQMLEAGELSFPELLDSLNLDMSHPMQTLAVQKLRRWPSALTVVKMRESA